MIPADTSPVKPRLAVLGNRWDALALGALAADEWQVTVYWQEEQQLPALLVDGAAPHLMACLEQLGLADTLRWSTPRRSLGGPEWHPANRLQDLLVQSHLPFRDRVRLVWGLIRHAHELPARDDDAWIRDEVVRRLGQTGAYALVSPYLEKRFGWQVRYVSEHVAPQVLGELLPRVERSGVSTADVGIFPGGRLTLHERLMGAVALAGGTVRKLTGVADLGWDPVGSFGLTHHDGTEQHVDAVVSLLPSRALKHLTTVLPGWYWQGWDDFAWRGLIEVQLELDWSPSPTPVAYSLDMSTPITSLHELSHLDPQLNHHRAVVAVRQWADPTSARMSGSNGRLIDEAVTWLKGSFASFRPHHVRDAHVRKDPRHSLICTRGLRRRILPMVTPLHGLLNASPETVYPDAPVEDQRGQRVQRALRQLRHLATQHRQANSQRLSFNTHRDVPHTDSAA